MLGAIIGDLAGTKYEYQEFLDSRKEIINVERRKSILDTNVELITKESFISDDSLLTIAIAEAIIYKRDYRETLKKYGQKYSENQEIRENFFKSAFSPAFIKWAKSESNKNGTSHGNGAAMRVSPVAYLFNDLDTVQHEALKTAIPSHDSFEAIKGAQSLASAIFLARQKKSKHAIKKYIMRRYEYELDYSLDELQKNNTFNGTSEVTVPQAIFVFLESNDFEDSIRKAISIGGDTDTIACMVGSIAEAYYGIPIELRNKALEQLSPDLKEIVIKAYKMKKSTKDKKKDIER